MTGAPSKSPDEVETRGPRGRGPESSPVRSSPNERRRPRDSGMPEDPGEEFIREASECETCLSEAELAPHREPPPPERAPKPAR